MEEDNVLAADLESVGSCTSLIKNEEDDTRPTPTVDDLYMNTHVGRCLEKVLSDMLEENEINIQQFISLKRVFNMVHRDAFSQCQSKLHVSISGKLDEFSSNPAGSIFHIHDCAVSGPATQVSIPKGTISLVHSWAPDS